MSYVLILKDKTEIVLKDYIGLGAVLVESADKAGMVKTWDKLTAENVSEIQIKQGDMLMDSYENVLLDSVSTKTTETGTLITNFAFRQKTELERLREELDTQAEQNKMLTSCILEMSEIVYGG